MSLPRGYLVGFGGSLLLTLLAYSVATAGSLAPAAALFVVMLLALVQFGLQARTFLHVGERGQPGWNSITFGFMLLVVAILVLGSLWIMTHLGEHSLPPEQLDSSIIHDEGVQPSKNE